MPKLFAPLIEGGRIKDEAGLKKLFREAVKKYHPDTASSSADQEKFIALYREYEEALAVLREADSTTKPVAVSVRPAAPQPPRSTPATKTGTEGPFLRFSPRELLDEFMDFMARGFPSRPPVKFSRSRYDLSRGRVLAMLAAPGGPGPERFLAFEEAFAAIAGKRKAASDSIFGAMYTILSLHHLGWRYMHAAVERCLAGCAALGLGAEVTEFLGYLYGLVGEERRTKGISRG